MLISLCFCFIFSPYFNIPFATFRRTCHGKGKVQGHRRRSRHRLRRAYPQGVTLAGRAQPSTSVFRMGMGKFFGVDHLTNEKLWGHAKTAVFFIYSFM
jgi:hypothetical protein